MKKSRLKCYKGNLTLFDIKEQTINSILDTYPRPLDELNIILI